MITNNGPAVANNVIVIETLPTELQPYTTTNLIPSINPTKGSFNPGTNIWTVGDMDRGEVQRLVLWTRPKSTANGKTVTNQARASSNNHDWNLSNNVASTSFVVGGVEISKSIFQTTPAYSPAISLLSRSQLPTSVHLISANSRSRTLSPTRSTSSIAGSTSSLPANTQNCSISNRNLSTFITLAAGQRANVIVRVRGNQRHRHNRIYLQEPRFGDLGVARFHI